MKAAAKPFFERLVHAPAWRAVLESALLMALMEIGFGLALSPASQYASGNGLLLALGFGGFWACLRARLVKGSLLRIILLEGLLALIVTAGMYAALELSVSVTQMPELVTRALGGLAWLLPLVAGMIGFTGLRVLRYLFELWNQQRKRHYYWELADAMILVVLIMMTALWSVAYLFAGSNPLAHNEAGGINFLENMLTRLFPGTMMLILIILGVLVVVLPPFALFSYWVARRLTRRLDTLGKAARQMRAGELSARVAVDGQDELSQLQMTFNEMAENLQTTTADLQRERDKLSALLQSQRQLTASVSHELRTPVATLRGYIESGLNPGIPSSAEEQRRTLEVMQQETARLQTLIEDLLTLSRAEVNALTLNLCPLDAGPILERVVRVTAPLAWQAHRVEVSASLPPELPMVYADETRLEQVLHNLVQNGERYTLPGGIVVVRAEQQGERLCICVQDSGQGIPPDAMERIWERFYQAPGQEVHGSAGLGLALVKELTEAMGGEVAAESVVGEGSRFSIFLPVST